MAALAPQGSHAPPQPLAALGRKRHRATSAMFRTGGASLASSLLSMAAAKIIASVLGPSGVALVATLQQTRQTAVVAATLNGGTALVQGSSARGGADREKERQVFVRTVLVLFSAATVVVAAVLLWAPQWTARIAGLDSARSPLVRWLPLAVAGSAAFVFLSALLNALGEIGKLAALQLAAPLTLALLAYPAAWNLAQGREGALIFFLTIPTATSAVCAWLFLRKHHAALREWFRGSGAWWSTSAAMSFFAVSGSMLATGLLGSATVLLVRSRILAADGLVVTGRFDAAWAISMNQVTLVLASMQAYFLPALARARDGAQRSAHVSHALWMAALVTAPVIVVIAALKPVILAALYSPEFKEGAGFLRWTLVGDYLKVASWILSTPLLAAADMKMFVAADVAAYGTFLTAAALLPRWWSAAEATSIAFVLMYALHLVLCGAGAWSRHGARPDRGAVMAWMAGLGVVLAATAVFWEIQ